MLIMWRLLKFLLDLLRVFQGREAGQGQSEVEKLQQENEALKTQMARLSTQLLDVGHGADVFPFFLFERFSLP